MSAEEGHQTFTTSDGREIRRPRRKKNNRLTDRYQKLADGVIDVEDLDEEELFKGMLRDSQGHIRGHHPAAIPWVMHDAYVRHVSRHLEATLVQSMPDILQNLIDIATGGGDHDAGITMDVRARAAMYLTDRIMGRPTERKELDVKVHARWEQAFDGGSLVVDIPDPDTIDAELVESPAELEPAGLPQGEVLVERTPASGRATDGAERPQEDHPQPRPQTGVKLR